MPPISENEIMTQTFHMRHPKNINAMPQMTSGNPQTAFDCFKKMSQSSTRFITAMHPARTNNSSYALTMRNASLPRTNLVAAKRANCIRIFGRKEDYRVIR